MLQESVTYRLKAVSMGKYEFHLINQVILGSFIRIILSFMVEIMVQRFHHLNFLNEMKII